MPNAPPLAHTPARAQNESLVHHHATSQKAIANDPAIGKATSIAWIGWPNSAMRESRS
jgi:hypothetical protein